MLDKPDVVVVEKQGDVAIVTMRFAPHNLVGCDLGPALIVAIDRAVQSGARAIVLKSALRHFSAGADLALFRGEGAQFRHEFDALGVMRALEECPVPTVAAVHGVALGGGFELALLCDFIVAAASSKFGLVEATLGLHPLMGGIQRIIARAGVGRANEIVMLARRHDAVTLERWGIVNRVVPDAQLDELSLALATELSLGPTVAHGCTKRLMRIYQQDGMRAADEAMAEAQRPIWSSEDLAIGLSAFEEKGPGQAVFVGR